MNKKDIARIEDYLTDRDVDNLIESSEPTGEGLWCFQLSCGAEVSFVVDDREGSLGEETLLLKALAILEIGR